MRKAGRGEWIARGGGRSGRKARRRRDATRRAVSVSSWRSGTRDGSSVIIYSFTIARLYRGQNTVSSFVALLVPCYSERRQRRRRPRRLGKKSPRFVSPPGFSLAASRVTYISDAHYRCAQSRESRDDNDVILELEQPMSLAIAGTGGQTFFCLLFCF